MSTRMRQLSCLLLVLAVAAGAAACSGDDGTDSESITVYSGRSEDLVQPLLDAFTAETGIGVEARYGDSAELALLIQTEGSQSPADVFISQSPGALGFQAGEGRLAPLAEDLTGLVDAGFRASDDTLSLIHI